MFRGKTVLDMGCGAGGKSLYYASLGAKKVVGTDIVASYRAEAEQLARQLGYRGVFSFVAGDACHLPLPDGTFDTIIMNDFMEHVSRPQAALLEAMRLLAPGGRIYLNFPPYYHPFGAHLSDAIYIPWVHLLFREQTLIEAYRDMTAHLPDGEARMALRTSVDDEGKAYFSYINRMTIRTFHTLLQELHLSPLYYREVPLRPYLAPLARSPLREMFVKMVVCVLEKPAGTEKVDVAEAKSFRASDLENAG